MNTCTEPDCHEPAFYPAKLRHGPDADKPINPASPAAQRCYRHRPIRKAKNGRPAPAAPRASRSSALEHDARHAALRLEQLAHQLTIADDHARREIAIADSFPTQTPGASIPIAEHREPRPHDPDCTGCQTCDPIKLTKVEAAADARIRLTNDRERMRDGLAVLDQLLTMLVDTTRRMSGTRIPHDVPRCAGEGIEGHEHLWTPHSRDPRNGWYDPLCADVANTTGLCNRCGPRERRWRIANGLPPRTRNAYQPATDTVAA